jgi:hypothetical protein
VKYLVAWRDQYHLSQKGGWAWLLERLKRAVRQTKESAEKDYRKACAISSDGLSIVIADFVFVVRGNGTVDKYMGSELCGGSSAFSEERISKPSSGNHRLPCGHGAEDAQKKAINSVVQGLYESVFLEPIQKGGQSAFVIKESYVPRSVLSTSPILTQVNDDALNIRLGSPGPSEVVARVFSRMDG